jgi:16S rRNA (uracil1498-N3)-methyltransferase
MTPPLFRFTGGVAAGAVVTLTGSEGRHAADVRRLQVGEPIWLTDGMGRHVAGVVAAVRRGELDVEVAEVHSVPAPAVRLVAVQALAKGGRDEAAIESMTEVGVDEIVGWSATRSIARWTDRTLAKWESTVAAAAKQSRRTWWPQVTGPATTAAVVVRLADAVGCVVLHESASESLSSVVAAMSAEPSGGERRVTGEVVVVIGPEGGITEAEVAAFSAAGGRPVRLGDTVLRSSTAGVAALAIISAQLRWP